MYRISGIGAAGSLDSAAECSSSSVLGGNTTPHRFYSSFWDYLKLQGESFPQTNSVMGDLRALLVVSLSHSSRLAALSASDMSSLGGSKIYSLILV